MSKTATITLSFGYSGDGEGNGSAFVVNFTDAVAAVFDYTTSNGTLQLNVPLANDGTSATGVLVLQQSTNVLAMTWAASAGTGGVIAAGTPLFWTMLPANTTSVYFGCTGAQPIRVWWF